MSRTTWSHRFAPIASRRAGRRAAAAVAVAAALVASATSARSEIEPPRTGEPIRIVIHADDVTPPTPAPETASAPSSASPASPASPTSIVSVSTAASRVMAGDTRYIEVKPGILLTVKGKRARKNLRFMNLRAAWGGDRSRIYETYGFPRYRHRENDQGIISEFWTYPEAYVTFVFRGDRLLRSVAY